MGEEEEGKEREDRDVETEREMRRGTLEKGRRKTRRKE